MIGLQTERLTFRQWSKSDFTHFANFFKDEVNAKYLGGVLHEEASWRLMASYIGHLELNGYSYLALEDTATHRLVGTVGVWNSHPWPEPELGYWLLPEAQGLGYAHEAGLAVLTYASKSIGLKTLVSYIDSANDPSKKLARKLGAKYDGEIELLNFGRHEVYRYW